MLPEYFALIGTGVTSIGGLYYLYCTIQGTVQPHKMTYFFWGLFPLIVFFAQISQGVGMIVWVSFIAGFTPFIILIAATFNKAAHWEIKITDYLYGVVAVLSMLIWYITKEPNTALFFALMADFTVGFPTLIKTYRYPQTESWKAYAINVFGFGIGVLSVQSWTFENYAFVVYLFLMNILIAILAVRRPKVIHIVIE